jgi:mannose-1-phosphate guanylyltransferase
MLIADCNSFKHERNRSIKSTPKKNSNRVALLLAGGDGMRLRELTSVIAGTPIPKQYCRLWKGSSLLEASISRARLFASCDHISVIINADHKELARDQVNALPDTNIIVQPLNRDTGPGMVFALLNLEQSDPTAMVAVFPTDHYIDNDWAFIGHVNRAVRIISNHPEKIAMLGIAPDRPETGYGYILPSSPIHPYSNTYTVGAFIEKPNAADAESIIARGGLWNTFVMIFRISRMLELLHELVPEEFEIMYKLRDSPVHAAEVYQNLTPWNISKQVLARIPQHLLVLKISNVQWSDWGTRESIERTYRTLNLAPFWNRWDNRAPDTEVASVSTGLLMAPGHLVCQQTMEKGDAPIEEANLAI